MCTPNAVENSNSQFERFWRFQQFVENRSKVLIKPGNQICNSKDLLNKQNVKKKSFSKLFFIFFTL